MPTFATLIFLCSLTLCTPADGKVFTLELTSKIEQFVQNLIQCREVVGLSLAVVKGNETWTRGFGVADKDSGRPVNSSTLFGIGSVTKAFASAILAMLIDDSRGKYTWETPLKNILGKDFQLEDEFLSSHVTIKDVLLHRTGLATSSMAFIAGFPTAFTREELIRRFQFLPVVGLFRDEWNYNNWMYALAGRLAEVMGGASWEDLLHQRIFQPLQMTDSRVIGYNVEVDADNFALPYVRLGDALVMSDPVIYKLTPAEAAGSIASSADDMAKWMAMHLQGGVTSQGDTIFTRSTLQAMYSPHIILSPDTLSSDYVTRPHFPVTFNSYGYGYAWFVASYRGYSVVWHTGRLFSYTTFLMLMKDAGLGIFISTNSGDSGTENFTLEELFFYITDLFLGEEPWLNISNACQYPSPWLNTTGWTSSNHTPILPGGISKSGDFVGEYGNKLFGEIAIMLNGSKELLVRYNRITGKLYRTNVDHILMMEMEGPLAFLTRTARGLRYFSMTFARADERGKYQDLLVSAPFLLGTDVLVYKRGVKTFDPPGGDVSESSTMSIIVGSVFILQSMLVNILTRQCL